jgi:hypothetical protein
VLLSEASIKSLRRRPWGKNSSIFADYNRDPDLFGRARHCVGERPSQLPQSDRALERAFPSNSVSPLEKRATHVAQMVEED